MDKTKRCVICNKTNKHKNHNRIFYYDPEYKDYHCDLCEGVVRYCVEYNGAWDDWSSPYLKDWKTKRDDWLKDAEAFERSLDFDLSEEAINEILKAEKSE